jgi:hypothetical protein
MCIYISAAQNEGFGYMHISTANNSHINRQVLRNKAEK